MRFAFSILALSLLWLPANAQKFPYKKLKEIKLQDKVTKISVDRLGGFYTVRDCGVEQYDPNGIFKNSYKIAVCNSIELLEAWPLVRLYAYQNKNQQFVVFDSHLEPLEKIDIDQSFAVEPQLACPSADLKSYWILDIDNSIKRVDLNSKSVNLESEELKSATGKFIYMREYQNMLFLLNANSGIYVMTKLGSLIFKVPETGINYFSFLGEDLYYLKGTELHFYNIFTMETHAVEVPAGFKFAVATDVRLILIKDGLAEVFEFSPPK